MLIDFIRMQVAGQLSLVETNKRATSAVGPATIPSDDDP
jgi:hypothetical protein